jgi:hypothetical protein
MNLKQSIYKQDTGPIYTENLSWTELHFYIQFISQVSFVLHESSWCQIKEGMV